jgi:chromosome segregation ATPase
MSQILERQRQRKKEFDISLQGVMDENHVLRTETQDLKRTINERDNQLKDMKDQRDKADEELDLLREQVASLEETKTCQLKEMYHLKKRLQNWNNNNTFQIMERARITEQLEKTNKELQSVKNALETEKAGNLVLSKKVASVQRKAEEKKLLLTARCHKAESEAQTAKGLQLEAEKKTTRMEKELQEIENRVREWKQVKERETVIVSKLFRAG